MQMVGMQDINQTPLFTMLQILYIESSVLFEAGLLNCRVDVVGGVTASSATSTKNSDFRL